MSMNFKRIFKNIYFRKVYKIVDEKIFNLQIFISHKNNKQAY